MHSAPQLHAREKLLAYTMPMVLFVSFLGLVSLLKIFRGPFWLAMPEYWVYPLQTICCGAVVLWFWRHYEFHRVARVPFVVAIAAQVCCRMHLAFAANS